MSSRPSPYTVHELKYLSPEVLPEFDYRKVRVQGRFDHSKEILLGPRTRDNKLGYHVITPLIRDQGSDAILVDRGFVPRERMEQSSRPESLVSFLH